MKWLKKLFLMVSREKKNKAVFLDRDGTINQSVPYLNNYADFVFFNGVRSSIRNLNESGFKVILITNQSGIGRGFFGKSELHLIHSAMNKDLELVGAKIDEIYYCPCHPSDNCPNRKPSPGMLKSAISKYSIDIEASFMVGDRLIDVEAGIRADLRTILVMTGYGKDESYLLDKSKFTPDFLASDLNVAVKFILEN